MAKHRNHRMPSEPDEEDYMADHMVEVALKQNKSFQRKKAKLKKRMTASMRKMLAEGKMEF